MDLISRQAAIELCDWYEHEFCECDYAIKALADELKSLPTAEPSATLMKVEVGVDKESLRKAMEEAELTFVAEPRKGKWIPVTNGRGGHECDQCHEYAPSWQTGEERLTNYCPNCGARMEESEESDGKI